METTTAAEAEAGDDVVPLAAPLVPLPPSRRRLVGGVTLAGFTLLSVVMTAPHPSRFASEIPGDGGDALFVVWTMRWVNHSLGRGWSTLWSPPIFSPARGALAYSDALLPVAPVFGALEWATGSTALAFNLVSLAAWVGTLWFTFRLALRLTASVPASIVAAVAFTFSAGQLAQYRHLQLVLGGLIAGVVLLMLWFLDEPGPRRGVALAAAVSALALTTSYLGLAALVCIGAMLAAHVATSGRRLPWRRLALGCTTALVVGLALLGPAALRYHEVTSDTSLHREVDHRFDLSPSDLLAVSVDNLHVGDWWPVRGHHEQKTSESWRFPGYVASVLAIVGVCSIRRARREMVLLGAAGATLLVLACGDVVLIGEHTITLPLGHLREAMPGFGGLRVPERLVVVPLLVLSVGTAFGARAIMRRLEWPAVAVVTLALVGATLYESATRLETTRVDPTAAGAAVNHELARRPTGIVVELPMRTSRDGPAWPFVETPRQLAASIDWQPRVNGHSGYEPAGRAALAAALNTFPAAAALAALDAAEVRYVVLRTALPIAIGPSRERRYGAAGIGVLTDDDARDRIAAMPRERIRRVDHVGDAYLIELADPQRRG